MSTAYEQLIAFSDVPPDEWPGRAELEPLWLQAANERLAQQRERIPVLGRLADQVGVTTIERLDDLVPLLFAHSNYKSYPEGFIKKNRWDLMNKWLDTLSSMRVDNVDIEGVDRPGRRGWIVSTPPGTRRTSRAGPPGRTRSCRRRRPTRISRSRCWSNRRSVSRCSPTASGTRSSSSGRSTVTTAPRCTSEPWSRRSGAPTPATSSPRSRCGSPRSRASATCARASPQGTAMPSEIATFERETAAKQAANAERLDMLMDALIEHRREPMYVVGFWGQYWLIIERARERGVQAGEFHPDHDHHRRRRDEGLRRCRATTRSRSSRSSASRPTT